MERYTFRAPGQAVSYYDGYTRLLEIRQAAEKAICASPELANLDLRINAVNARVVLDASRGNPGAGRVLQREQDEFIVRRNAGFGRSDYDLQKAMRERLDHLLAIGAR